MPKAAPRKGPVHKCSRKKFNRLYKAELRDATAWYRDSTNARWRTGGKVPKAGRAAVLRTAKARAEAACGGTPLYGCPDEPIAIERVPLGRDGYTANGRYFGRGAPVFQVYGEHSSSIPTFNRAGSKAALKAQLRKKCPGIQFER